MTKGKANRAFILVAIGVLTSSVSDILRWVVPVSEVQNTFKVQFTMFWEYVYFISRNLIASMYVVYVLILSGLWFKIKNNRKVMVLICIIPVLVIITVFSNLFTHKIFYLDSDITYHRGEWIYLMYIYSMIAMMSSLYLVIKHKDLFKTVDFWTLLIIYPVTLFGVFFQLFHPEVLVENITTTFVLFAISLIIHRPEENLNITTGTLGFNAYIQELKRNFKVGIPIKLIFVHIDNYKQLKRQFNISNYNNLLKQIIKEMSDSIVGYGVDIFNLDNCNFVLNCHQNNGEILKNIAQKIQDYLNSAEYKETKLYLVTTICVVNCPEEMDDMEKVISFSNNFFNTIQRKNVVTYLSEESKDKFFILRTEMDDIIKRAIRNNNFQMYYQPIYSIEKKKFCSAEALIRLIDDEYGFISPGLFIPAAEASGAIHQIGDFVIEDVCKFISSHNLEKMGLEYIEINLSVAQCIEQNFAEKLIKVLEKNNIDSSKINLEITETAADFDKETTTRNINVLSDYGLSFSLDDYGTGYSNIKRVTTMPLSIIKLDKTFVDEYEKHEMRIVIKKTVDMFKRMDKLILVEGIEDKDALDHFTEIGCNYIQGFYFSKPLPAPDFVKFIRDKNKRGK